MVELRKETTQERSNQIKMIAKMNSQNTRNRLRNKKSTKNNGILIAYQKRVGFIMVMTIKVNSEVKKVHIDNIVFFQYSKMRKFLKNIR